MNDWVPPVISVIIPTYNMAEYLGDAIESVLDGDFQAVEVIVVDDGSTDETEDVIARYTTPSHSKYDERVRYHSQLNQGKPAAVNQGLSLATGSHIAILDADDKLTPDSLSTRYAHLESESRGGHDLVIGGFEVFNEGTTHGTRLPPEQETPEELRRAVYLQWRSAFSLNACLVSRRLIDRTGTLDERFSRCEDIDYIIRLLEVADRPAVLPSVVYQYRKHRESTLKHVRLRMQTGWFRVRAFWKNYQGIQKWGAVLIGLSGDIVKLVYEALFGPYKR